jgi:hypothetical protein
MAVLAKVKNEFDIEAAWENLKATQKPDGSFGHSITFTAIALPALTGQTYIGIKLIPCPDPDITKKNYPTLVVAYELENQVHILPAKAQRTYGGS